MDLIKEGEMIKNQINNLVDTLIFFQSSVTLKRSNYKKCSIIIKNSAWSIKIAAAQAQVKQPR